MASTLQFAFYFVSPLDIYFVETDSSTTALSPVYYRLSGEMIAQNSSNAFTAASLAGTSVATGTGLNGNNASVLAGLLTSAGAGSATLIDENNGGAITSPSPSFSGTYSVAGNGRVPLTNLGPRAAVFTYRTRAGLLPRQRCRRHGGLAGATVRRPFCRLLRCKADIRSAPSLPVETSVASLVGQVSSDGAGSVTGIVDEVDPPTMSTPEGKLNLDQSLIAHINFIGSNGRDGYL